ncbi:hypothetical protein [Moorena producens]|uniref:hypothetical protein n=1 Tax=Moorena producens TaxID=1155739 RepID=UPI001313EB25|nr:hypothetical protein [Moorena producens]
MISSIPVSHAKREWFEFTVRQARLVSHAKREWGKPRQLLMGGTPKTALPSQDRAASPVPLLHRFGKYIF